MKGPNAKGQKLTIYHEHDDITMVECSTKFQNRAMKSKPDLFEFIKLLPMTYDETKVLEMEIGDHITMARRTADTCLVAALANESGRKLEMKLDFLKPGVSYDVTLYEDTADSHFQFPGSWNRKDAAKKKVPFKLVETKRELYQIRNRTVKQGDMISATLAPGGGHCMWIRPKEWRSVAP